MNRVVFSGIQPSGNLHIGNYIGAVRQWVSGQNEGLNIFCIVDMHAITVPQEPQVLREKTQELAALILASGVDPEKSLLFIQSHNPDHANLAWMLNCFTSMGQMNRMTQYKEKSEGKDVVSVGLFGYPVLMAADILLYDTTEVPVGEDQKQHVELTRDAAERFNSKFGQTFLLPEPKIPKVGARIMSLREPTKKMSKSDGDPMGAIGLLDDEATIIRKIATAVTDSQRDIVYDASRPGIYNLIEIYSKLSGEFPDQVEKKFEGKGYKEFKEGLTEQVLKVLLPLQEKYRNLRESDKLIEILAKSAARAKEISGKKLKEVKEKVGFLI